VVQFCEKAPEQRGHDLEYRMIAADGRVVWLRDQMTVMREGNHPARLRGVMVDITERNGPSRSARLAAGSWRAWIG